MKFTFPDSLCTQKSTIFQVLVRINSGMSYVDYDVNKVFELTHLELFKIIPPIIGNVINIGSIQVKIDLIEYDNNYGLIKIWTTRTEKLKYAVE